MGKQSFSLCRASPPPRWCQTLQGVHSLSPCLPSIMQSLMDSTQGRRHGQPDHWEHKQKPPPPPPPSSYFPLSLNPSVSTHELLFWHTQVDKHAHGLLPPPMFFYCIAPLLPHFSVSVMLPVITAVSRIKLRSVALYFPLSRQLVGREWICIIYFFSPSSSLTRYTHFLSLKMCALALHFCSHLQDVCVPERSCSPPPPLSPSRVGRHSYFGGDLRVLVKTPK